jgi:hypothetical protein
MRPFSVAFITKGLSEKADYGDCSALHDPGSWAKYIEFSGVLLERLN